MKQSPDLCKRAGVEEHAFTHLLNYAIKNNYQTHYQVDITYQVIKYKIANDPTLSFESYKNTRPTVYKEVNPQEPSNEQYWKDLLYEVAHSVAVVLHAIKNRITTNTVVTQGFKSSSRVISSLPEFSKAKNKRFGEPDIVISNLQEDSDGTSINIQFKLSLKNHQFPALEPINFRSIMMFATNQVYPDPDDERKWQVEDFVEKIIHHMNEITNIQDDVTRMKGNRRYRPGVIRLIPKISNELQDKQTNKNDSRYHHISQMQRYLSDTKQYHPEVIKNLVQEVITNRGQFNDPNHRSSIIVATTGNKTQVYDLNSDSDIEYLTSQIKVTATRGKGHIKKSKRHEDL